MRSSTIRALAIRSLLAVGAVVAFASVPINALAIELDGQITFSGVVEPLGASDFVNATTLTFPEPVSILGGSSTTGHFAVLKGETATFNDLVYDAISLPVTPLWSVSQTSPTGTWTFDLESMIVQTRVLIPGVGSFLNLSGTGTLHAPNFDATGGDWTLSASSPNTLLFSFASTTVALPQPEPDAAILFLAGTALVARSIRRKR